MSYRRLWVLITRLPQESRTQTALRDSSFAELVDATPGPEKFGPWALTNYQLAALTDSVQVLQYITAKAAGGDWPKPEPTPRPGLNRLKRIQSTANVTYLHGLRAPGG
jgi:hypothetical protein